MIHLSLNRNVVCLLDRYFSDDVALDTTHQHVCTFPLTERIEVRIYQDPPMHLALFYVDGAPVLKELMIDGGLPDYIDRSKRHLHLSNFILDYATPA